MNIQYLAQKFYDHSIHFKGFSKATVKRYRQAINYYCQFTSFTTIEEVTNKSIRELFYYGRVEKHWKPSSFISYQKSLSVFFKWCVAKKYITEDPIADLESPRIEKRLPTKLTKHEACRVLESIYNYPYDSNLIRYRNHAIFSVMILAGLRKQEVIRLRYTDVDFENNSLFVHEGKGSKDRAIPINAVLRVNLEKYVQERKKCGKTCIEFFASSVKNRGISETTFKRIIDSVRKYTGITFTAHKLRHTFATLMMQGGCDIYSLSKMMGHEDIKTTTLYLFANQEHLRSQILKHPLNN